jgi:hypothetical protein
MPEPGWTEPPQRMSNAVLVERLDFLRSDFRRIEIKIDNWEVKFSQIERDISARFITQEEFWPVKMIAFGFAGLILVGFVGLLIHTVGWQP